MKNILFVSQIISALILIVLILIQSKGKGLGRAFGMGSQVSFTRRGLEKLLFRLTFIATFIFILISIFQVLA